MTADEALERMRERWRDRPPIDLRDVEERAAIRLEDLRPELRIRAQRAPRGAARLFVEVRRGHEGERSTWWSAYVHSLEEVDEVLERPGAPRP